MAKILFAFDDMNVGGVANVMLRFFNELKYFGHKITLLLANNCGGWIERIPKDVDLKMIPLTQEQKESVKDFGISSNIKKNIKRGKFISAIKIWLKRLSGDNLAALSFDFDKVPCLGGEYDIAIAYHYHNTFITRYVAEKIDAKIKYVWLHNDLDTTKYNYKYTYSYISNFDKIFCVSQQLCNEAKKAYPNYTDRIMVFYNSIDYVTIAEQSKEKQYEISNDKLSILSVGRLNIQKGFDIAVRAARMLKKRGHVFWWYIIGEGEERKKLEKLIRKLGVADCVKLLGRKDNPFKYMKACDIYVQPSRHEGFCTTTNEAKFFGKPIIVTNVAGMDEQFTNEENGLIVNTDYKDIANAIDRIIKDSELTKKLSVNVVKTISANNEINKYFHI